MEMDPKELLASLGQAWRWHAMREPFGESEASRMGSP